MSKVYCKDCKHFDIWDRDYEVANGCPIASWALGQTTADKIYFDEETTPPEDINCFEPKEAK